MIGAKGGLQAFLPTPALHSRLKVPGPPEPRVFVQALKRDLGVDSRFVPTFSTHVQPDTRLFGPVVPLVRIMCD